MLFRVNKIFLSITLLGFIAVATVSVYAQAPTPVIKSFSGEVLLRVAGSDWFPAHQGTSIDPGMDIKIPDGGYIEAAAGRTLQLFWFGPGEGAGGRRFKPDSATASVNIEFRKGQLLFAYIPPSKGDVLAIRTNAGIVSCDAGLFSISTGTGKEKSLKIAASEGKACLKPSDGKPICTDEKKMIVSEQDKTPRTASIDNTIISAWKKYDWDIIGVKPDLKIIQPQDGAYATDPGVIIVGVTSKGASVKINNKETPVKPDGSFTAQIILFEGENKISIQARSRAGKTTSLTRTVLIDTTPPLLTVSQPTPNFDPTSMGTCDQQNYYLQIFGLTEPGVALLANGVNISRFIEDDGSFLVQDFPIRRTERTLSLEAEDMFHRRTREVIHIGEPSDPERCR